MSRPRGSNDVRPVERELRVRLGQQAAVAELGRSALAGTDMPALLREAVSLAASNLGADLCEVWELLSGDELLLRAGVGWDENSIGTTTMELDAASQIGRALLGGETVVVEDLRAETRFEPPPLLVRRGVVSCMSVPVEGRGRTFGVICAHTTKRRSFTTDDANFLKAVANVLASAISRSEDEEALRKWRNVFEHAEWGVVVGAADGKTLELINPAFARMHGYTVEELKGQPITKVFAPECRAALARHVRAAHRDGHHVWESVHLRKDGSKFPVLMDVTAVNDEEGRPAYRVVNVQDITERRDADERLRQSERRLRDALDGLPAFVGVLTPDGTLVEANRAALSAAGLAPEDVLGLPFEETYWWSFSEESKTRLREAIGRAARGEPSRFDALNRVADGRFVTVDFMLAPLVDSRGRVAYLIPSGVDITERRRAEERIRQQAALLDVAHDAILVRDLDDRILYWNRGAERLYGWTAREAMGRHVLGFIYTEPSPQFREAQAELLRHGEWSGEVHQVTKDGRDIIVESRWTLVRNDEGEPRAKLVVNTDVTERKRLEVELQRAAHLSLMGELAAGLAHEIKNPLAGIKGAVDILIRRREEGDPEVEVLEDVRHAVERIDKTVLALLQRARPLPPQFAAASLDEVAHRAVLLARHHAAKASSPARQVSVSFDTPPEPIMMPIDAAQIEDAVLNLIMNAVAAVDGDGRVFVCVRREPPCEVGAQGEAVIEVRDTGRGIAAEDLARVFSPFYTTTEGGTGLGLPSVRRIARAHGGRVEVISEQGRGSAFAIRLPLPAET